MRSVIVCLLLLYITAVSIIPINASDAKVISSFEAKELVAKAAEFHSKVHVYNQYDPTCTLDREKIYIEENILTLYEYFRVFEEKLPGGSYEAMCAYAETIYAKNIADLSYAFVPYGVDQATQFIRDINNVLFMTCPIDYPAALLNDEYYLSNNDCTQIDLEIISSNSKTAIAEIAVHDVWGWSDKVICKFTNTAEGWRIDESEYSVLLAGGDGYLLKYRTAASPSTSDPTFNLVFILPTVSVAAIASAFCLMRRRKENVL